MYLKKKKVRAPGSDPVADLRRGWDLHIEFGLANPAIYALMYGDPRPGVTSPAAAAGEQILKQHMRRIAAAGQLQVSEERAAQLVHASACGTVMTLLTLPEDDRDLSLSESAREAVLAAITTGVPPVKSSAAAAAAITMRAVLPQATVLSAGERHLLDELLERLGRAG